MATTNTNVVVVSGNLVRDPEEIGSGKGAKFSLAVSEAFKPKDSEDWVEKVSFFDVTQWGAPHVGVLKFLSKGSRVNVTGKLVQERWEKDGEKKQRVVIHAIRVEFMPKGTGSAGTSSGSSSDAGGGDDFDGDEEIPF